MELVDFVETLRNQLPKKAHVATWFDPNNFVHQIYVFWEQEGAVWGLTTLLTPTDLDQMLESKVVGYGQTVGWVIKNHRIGE